MNTNLAIATDCKDSVAVKKIEIQGELLAKQTQLKKLTELKKYTKKDRKAIARLEKEIEGLQLTIVKIDKLLDLPPGSWVHNGSSKPGQVIDVRITGKVPEALIKWWGDKVPIPESPTKLTAIDPQQMLYRWNAERFPRLIRPHDQVECDELLILEANFNLLNQQDEDYSKKKTYLTKRIQWINEQDFKSLEFAVNRGLKTFYEVGEALWEICDRELYKLAGYTDFRVYLKERWNMGKSTAYRLIGASKVINNLLESKSVPNWEQSESESVPHGGQIIIPDCERVVRELAKAPEDKQPEVWQEAVNRADGEQPTSNIVKEVVQELNPLSFTDKQLSTENNQHSASNLKVTTFDKTILPRNLIEDFKPGQIVRICVPSDRPDKRLVGLNKSLAKVLGVNVSTVNLKIFSQIIPEVSPNDLEILDGDYHPTICLSSSQEDFAELLEFDSPEEIIRLAIAAKNTGV